MEKNEVTFVRLRKSDEPVPMRLFSNSATCGELFDSSEIAEIIDVNELIETKNDEALAIANGNSMIDVGIHDGDFLILDYGKSANNGDIVVAMYEGATTVKFYHRDNRKNVVTLYPANPECKKKVYSGEDLEHFQVVAVVTQYLHRFKGGITVLNKLKAEDRVRDVRDRIGKVLSMIKNTRNWFAVCKAMMKLRIVGNNDFTGALKTISEITDIEFEKKDLDSILKMNVQSMSKDIKDWDENDAPVRGSRFHHYKHIAEEFIDY